MDQQLFNKLGEFKIDLTEDDILNFIIDRYRWPYQYSNGQPSIEAINKNGSKNRNLFLEDSYVDSEKTISLYKSGFTLILSRVEYLNKDIVDMHKIISHYVGNHVNANIYFGNGTNSVSFPTHQHEYDVFVKNVSGSSKWIVEGEEFTLCDQQCLFFSAGARHEVSEIYEPKISITWNLVKK